MQTYAKEQARYAHEECHATPLTIQFPAKKMY